MSILKTICREIGCSGTDPQMCQNSQEDCAIIRKIVGSEICSEYKNIKKQVRQGGVGGDGENEK
jgi:hypothetical protein